MPVPEKKPAVFLDRDGTINVDKHYLHKIEDFEFIPGALQAIKTLKNAGYTVVVVTNQSGVARGYFSMGDVIELHEHIQKELAVEGTGIDAFYICPHHPDKGLGKLRIECDCRKGQPGLLFQASADLGIDLHRSYMVGDKVADIVAGENAGCRAILVLTGYGRQTRLQIDEEKVNICEDLAAAVDLILDQEKIK